MKQTDFAKTLTRFLSEYLPGQRNLSTNTIKSYRDTFKQLLIFCNSELSIKPEHPTFAKIKVGTIRDFLIWLEKTRNVGINTCNQRLAAIHSFYRYTQSEQPEILLECQRMLGIPFKKRGIQKVNHASVYIQFHFQKYRFMIGGMKIPGECPDPLSLNIW